MRTPMIIEMESDKFVQFSSFYYLHNIEPL